MRFIVLTVLWFAFTASILAQSVIDELEATNFTMPSSPAFDLLGVSPSGIHKPGLPRDIQLNWLIRGGGLDPNLAIEVEPGWLFLNRRKSRSGYQKSDWLFKTASSLNFSLGTAKIGNQQSLAYGLKLNLYNAKDPILDNELIEQLTPVFTEQEVSFNNIILEIETTTDQVIKDSLLNILKALSITIAEDSLEFMKKSQQVLTNWEKENWNATMIDLGFGQVFNYNLPTIFEIVDTANTNGIDSITFANKAHALWLSGIVGLGKNGMLNAMAKYTREYDGNSGIKAGLNMRYGNQKINIYAEFVHSTLHVFKNTVAYGVDYRLENGFIVQASLRTMFNNQLELKQLIPTINFAFQPQMKRNGT